MNKILSEYLRKLYNQENVLTLSFTTTIGPTAELRTTGGTHNTRDRVHGQADRQAGVRAVWADRG
jgi:hypothetical protein